MQDAHNKCFMETRITNKLIHHNETLCVLLSICDCCEVKCVYIDILIFWVRTSCRQVHFQTISRNHPNFTQPESSLTLLWWPPTYLLILFYDNMKEITLASYKLPSCANVKLWGYISQTSHTQKLHSCSKC